MSVKWSSGRDEYTPTPRECVLALLGGAALLLVFVAGYVGALVLAAALS